MTGIPARIHICEPLSYAAEHAPFNAALLETVAYAFPGVATVFYAEPSHLVEVQGLLGHVESGRVGSLRFTEQTLAPRRASFRKRLLSDYRLLCKALQGLVESDLLILSASIPSVLFALFAARLRLRSKARVQAVIHGNLVEISGWRSYDPRSRWFDLRSAMRLALKVGVQFIVLEEGIRQAAIKEMPELENRMAVLEHPFPGEARVSVPEAGGLPAIGFLGMAAKVKGFGLYTELAQQVASLQPNRLAFDVIGPLPPDEREPATQRTDWSMFRRVPSKDWVSKDDYHSALAAIHYVCLPYNPDHYRFSASGILLDAIQNAKPVIALRNPTLVSIFERYGDVGYLCEDEMQMIQTVLMLAEHFDQLRYQQQSYNMQALAADRLPKVQSKRLTMAFALLGSSVHSGSY